MLDGRSISREVLIDACLPGGAAVAPGRVRPPGPAPSRNDAAKAARPQETFGPCRLCGPTRRLGARRGPMGPFAAAAGRRCESRATMREPGDGRWDPSPPEPGDDARAGRRCESRATMRPAAPATIRPMEIMGIRIPT